MMIECLIKRDGPTTVEFGKTRYTFLPLRRPGVKSESPGNFVTSVCEVNSEEHLDKLLKTKQYREYREGQPAEDNASPTIDFSGYSIVKHQDGRVEGYRVEDRNVKPLLFAGNDGQWKESMANNAPFDTEFAAWQWLKEELEMNPREADEQKYPCTVEGCGKVFDKPHYLANHMRSHK